MDWVLLTSKYVCNTCIYGAGLYEEEPWHSEGMGEVRLKD